MPSVPSRFTGLGVGFSPYLIKPPEDVVRWTVGEPGFDTPRPVVDAAIASSDHVDPAIALSDKRCRHAQAIAEVELARACLWVAKKNEPF